MKPVKFDTIMSWYEKTRAWEIIEKVDDNVQVIPGRVEACETPLEWEIRYTVKEKDICTGAHIALELPVHFLLDHGIPYPVGRNSLVHIKEMKPGFNAAVDVRLENDDVQVEFEVSAHHRFYIVDIVITEGKLAVGDSLSVMIGDKCSSRVKAPRHAQKFLFACAVDYEGDGNYRGIRETPYLDVIGAFADSFKVIVPQVVEKGEKFSIVVCPVDRYNKNIASGYNGKIKLHSSNGKIVLPESIEIEINRNGVFIIEDAVMKEEGYSYVIAFDEETGIMGKSNPVTVGFSEERIYTGEIHGQGYDSIGTGSVEEYFTWGRDVEYLDFCATAYHYGGRYDVYKDMPGIWDRIVVNSNRFNEPGRYVTFVSYEWRDSGDTGTKIGHKNVYYRGDCGEFYGSEDERYNSAEKLWDTLKDKEVITIPHHPKFCGHNAWYKSFNNEMQRLVEIYSSWGDSEEGGKRSVRSALLMGHRLGFTGGTDTHEAQPAHGVHEFLEGAGVTCVYVKELTRDAIFKALYSRRCYATTGARLFLDFVCNGMKMGQEVQAEEKDRKSRKIKIKVIGTGSIKNIQIIRNGKVVYSVDPGKPDVELEWEDKDNIDDLFMDTLNPDGKKIVFYYVRVEQFDRHKAWASPCWFIK